MKLKGKLNDAVNELFGGFKHYHDECMDSNATKITIHDTDFMVKSNCFLKYETTGNKVTKIKITESGVNITTK